MAIAFWSCTSEYDVRLRYEDSALRSQAARYEVALVESCALNSSAPIAGATRHIEFSADEAPEALGEVAHGSYSLFARAWSADCELVAVGCRNVQVGVDNQLSVQLVAASGQRCAADDTCSAGVCGSALLDAGVDASPDGSPIDGSATDAALSDVQPDAGDDANSDVGVDGAGVDGACVEGSECGSGGTCRGGGCCEGCFDGVRCQSGTVVAACGTGGASCDRCGVNVSCLASECIADNPAVLVEMGASTGHAIDADGNLWTWGGTGRSDEVIGTGGVMPSQVPVIIGTNVRFVAVDSVDTATVAGCFGDERLLSCWGRFRDDSGFTAAADYVYDSPTDVPVPAAIDISSIDVSSRAGLGTLALAGTNGSIWSMGLHYCESRGGPRGELERVPVLAEGTEVRTGWAHGCFGDRDNGWSCFGIDSAGYGYLGVDGSTGCLAPLAQPAAAVELIPAQFATAYLDTAGRLFTFGRNENLGLGHEGGGATAVATGETFEAVEMARGYGCGLRAGQVYCWGDFDQTGAGNSVDHASADPIAWDPEREAIRQISLGASAGCGVGVNGRIICWGSAVLGGGIDGVDTSATVRAFGLPTP